jgi:hypothetical protein
MRTIMAKNGHHTRNEPARTPPPGMRPVTPIDLVGGIAAAFAPEREARMVALPDGQAVPLEDVFKTLASVVARELCAISAEPVASHGTGAEPGDIDAGDVGGFVRSYPAGNDIPPARAVLVNDELGYAVLGFAGPEMTLGVAPDGAKQGEPVDVALSGVEDVEAAGPVRRGAYVEVTQGGRIIEATVKAGHATACLGKALRTATAAGQRVPILISPFKLYG